MTPRQALWWEAAQRLAIEEEQAKEAEHAKPVDPPPDPLPEQPSG